MSTIPGHETWHDAGLVDTDPAELVELEPDAEQLDAPLGAIASADAEEYHPGDARPDLLGEADPADVTEQAVEVPSDERDDYP